MPSVENPTNLLGLVCPSSVVIHCLCILTMARCVVSCIIDLAKCRRPLLVPKCTFQTVYIDYQSTAPIVDPNLVGTFSTCTFASAPCKTQFCISCAPHLLHHGHSMRTAAFSLQVTHPVAPVLWIPESGYVDILTNRMGAHLLVPAGNYSTRLSHCCGGTSNRATVRTHTRNSNYHCSRGMCCGGCGLQY
jgi:hypothetical protein